MGRVILSGIEPANLKLQIVQLVLTFPTFLRLRNEGHLYINPRLRNDRIMADRLKSFK